MSLAFIQVLLLLQSREHFLQDAKVFHDFLLSCAEVQIFLLLNANRIDNDLLRFQFICLSTCIIEAARTGVASKLEGDKRVERVKVKRETPGVRHLAHDRLELAVEEGVGEVLVIKVRLG